ncbi:STAS domain-containing protein [Maridesulfovibrio zosterae]|uniref:STAS domain-containing protein n=1 Tax=Maridesulfovibrio zosterae TaxID=82171 RepID=UPI0003FF2345|nr:STAS domain-containing protein [Maridesulfovibrio zosterae]
MTNSRENLIHNANLDNTEFDFTEEDNGKYIKLCPKGCINTATVKFMKKRLYDLSCENDCKIIMSLKDVKSIDSVGLGTIITAHKNCAHCGGQIVFSDLSPLIMKTMKMLSLDRYLKMTVDLKSAESIIGC